MPKASVATRAMTSAVTPPHGHDSPTHSSRPVRATDAITVSVSIGFTVLNYENKALRAEIETLKKSLEEFQGSEPTNGEPRRTENGEGFADTMEGALAGLAKLAS